MAEFTIQVPTDLQLLILSGTCLPKQLDLVLKCTNLIKLDLSANAIEILPNLHPLKHLRILYLHQNQIRIVDPIFKLQSLNYLTLFLNPISSQLSLRRQVIQQLKLLWAFDFNVATDNEKYKALEYKSVQTRLPWPIINNGVSNQLMSLVWLELDTIRRLYERCSVVLIIQRHIRGYLSRKTMRLAYQNKIRILAFVRQAAQHWRQYAKNRMDLQKIMAEQHQEQINRVKQIIVKYRLTKGKDLKEQKSAKIIMKVLQIYKFKHKCLQEEIKYGQYYRLFFNKDQQQLFYILLQKVLNKIGSPHYSYPNKDVLIKQVQQLINKRGLQSIDDYSNKNKLYIANVISYRLPNQNTIRHLTQDQLITQASKFLKVSTCLQQRQLAVIRRWMMISKFEQDSVHQYPYLQKYDDTMPDRKSYIPRYQINQQSYTKYETTLKAINRFQQREYRQLLVVTLNPIIALELVKQIKYYNQFNKEYFIPYFERQLVMAAAALKIQRKYRAYRDVIKQGMTIKQIIAVLKKERCIKIIQKWFRDIKAHHRGNFFKQIGYLLKKVKSNVLYMPLSWYMNIDIIPNRLRFMEQQHSLHCYGQTCIAISELMPNISIIPKWLYINNTTKQLITNPATSGDVYHILHFKTTCEFKHCYNRDWVQFTFPSVDECRNRFILLALNTYRFKYQAYMALFTEIDLIESEQFIVSSIARMHRVLNTTATQIPQQRSIIIPATPAICLSITQIFPKSNTTVFKFYRNGITSKVTNIARHPVCKSEEIVLYQSLSINITQCETIQQQQQQTQQTQPTQLNRLYQQPTASTNFKTINFPADKILNQDIDEDQVIKLKQISTNVSRQCYRNKSQQQRVSQPTADVMLMRLTNKSQSNQVYQLGFHINTKEHQLQQQRKLREDQQQRIQREQIDKIRIYKEVKLKLRTEKSFEQEVVNGQGMISRQGERYSHQLRNRVMNVHAKSHVHQQYTHSKNMRDIVKFNTAVKQANRPSKQVYQAPQPPQLPSRVQQSRPQCQYIHSVLPEEIYPLKIQFQSDA